MGHTVGREELLQVLLGTGVRQIAHKEAPRVCQVLLLLVLPQGPASPGCCPTSSGPRGSGWGALVPEHFDIAPAWGEGVRDGMGVLAPPGGSPSTFSTTQDQEFRLHLLIFLLVFEGSHPAEPG